MTTKEQVTKNIKKAVEDKDFHRKVEVNDPILTREEKDSLITSHLQNRNTLSFKIKNITARALANILSSAIAKSTNIKGVEKLEALRGGAIITSNHFSPTDTTSLRVMARKMGKKRLNVVCKETNLAMTGLVGFLMNYADTIPITDNFHYMQKKFTPMLKELLKNGEYVLIYPEREMWKNYRKPRPLMEGAYYLAAKLSVPIIPCFVEITDKNQILHILDPLFPNPEKSLSENCRELLEKDYKLKVEAYERVYKKKLDYTFDSEDIAP